MNKTLYKVVVTVDTGAKYPVVVDELELPSDCEVLLKAFRKYEEKQCLRICRALFDDYYGFGSRRCELVLAFHNTFTLVLGHPLATFGIREAD